jgi:tetratricopeptide (TPR) repeat protein
LHQEIRYTGVEFGDASVIPAKPEETLKWKYGDCKDKAALLVAMLDAAGIRAHLALLSSGTGQDVDPQRPGFGMFDHAIVQVPGSPDVWIDATAETLQFGALPSGDQGRLALIVKPETTGLTPIPNSPSTANVMRETREFFLPDYGKARVVETTEGEGNADSSLRSAYGFAEREKSTKELLSYMRNTYVSDAQTKIEHSKRDDYSRPFQLKLEIPEARRAFVGESNTEVYILLSDLFSDLPAYFTNEDGKKPDPKEVQRKRDRKVDFILPEAGVQEWHYRITLPPGAQLKKLPENETLEWGGAKYSARFRAERGMAFADLTFDTGKRRFTVEEAAAVRSGVLDLLRRPALSLTFEPQGQALLNSGKIREGISVFRSMVRAHPVAPIYRVRLASALLLAGCGEQSRTEAKRATEIAPDSLIAWRNLGWARLNDLVGRQFQPGWDPPGAETALRKALAIDPRDSLSRRNLAVSLEHDIEGERYADKGRLSKAVEVLQGFEDDQLVSEGLLDNLLIDLAYVGRFQPLLKRLDSSEMTPNRLALRLVAMAATQNSQTAINDAASRASNEASRQSALQSAAETLLRTGRYAEAADLMAAAEQGVSESGQLAARASLIRGIKHVDPGSLKRDTPENAIRSYVMALVFDKLDPSDLFALDALAAKPVKQWQASLDLQSRTIRAQMHSSHMPASIFADLMNSVFQFKVEQNNDGGARVYIGVQGAAGEWIYLVLQNDEYRLLGLNKSYEGIGRHVLAEIKAGNLQAAHKWLDWVREEVKTEGGDDPLSDPVFPRVWTKSSPENAALMNYAAATLLENGEVLPTLESAIRTATEKSGRAYAELGYLRAALQDRRWDKAEPVAKELLAGYPDSDTVISALCTLYSGRQDWGKAETALHARLKADPENINALRLLASVKAQQSSFDEAGEISLKLAESARGAASDWNRYGWVTLLAGRLTPEVIQRVQKATTPNTNDGALLHTLSAMYAEGGDAAQARQLMLRTMSAWKLAQPNPQCWYVFGRIAEDYGITDAALSYYAKVDEIKPEQHDPTSTYALAQRRIAAIKQEQSESHMGTVVPDPMTGSKRHTSQP